MSQAKTFFASTINSVSPYREPITELLELLEDAEIITLTQTSSQLQPLDVVYEYSFKVFNPERQDTQDLTAAFISQPTVQQCAQWLLGWTNCGYRLCSLPHLINTLH